MPTMLTPLAPSVQADEPDERPRNTQRFGDASNVEPGYENEYVASDVVSVTSLEACALAPQPFKMDVTA